jgi:hypothetical protein
VSEIGDIASILMLNGGGSLPRKGDNPVLEALIDGALKKSQEPGFFSREAGQNRRAWLDETVNYFTPPELRGPLGLLNEANPVTSMERASTASQTMLAPETSGWGRVAAGGDMLSNMAGIVAPAMVAGKAGMPAVNAIEEGLLGWAPGMPAAAGNFMADEFGGMRLYHGSPHDFDKFSMDKIGTGEGAQAYGHGLYFAENEGVAKGYRDALSLDAGFSYKGKSGLTRDQLAEEIAKDFGGGYLDNVTTPRGVADGVMDELVYGPASRKLGPERTALREKLLADIQRTDPGKMYEVDVNANPEDFLDWDMPLAGQSPAIRDSVRTLAPSASGMDSGQRLLDRINPNNATPHTSAADRARGVATERLREAGIPGIKYLDAGSRGAGDGSRNYVVFDENLINIVKKYGVAGAATMLGVSQAEVAQAMEGQQ